MENSNKRIKSAIEGHYIRHVLVKPRELIQDHVHKNVYKFGLEITTTTISWREPVYPEIW